MPSLLRVVTSTKVRLPVNGVSLGGQGGVRRELATGRDKEDDQLLRKLAER